jgi:hypothetical protein
MDLKGEYILRENMQKVLPGDFIVAFQNKAYTLFMIYAKENETLTIEEASVPQSMMGGNVPSWREWFASGAPGSTCWIRYKLNLQTSQIQDAYSFTQHSWVTLSGANNILAKLINLNFAWIPTEERKKAGSQPAMGLLDRRPIWQPRLIVNGSQIPGIPFDGWKARWPKDGSDLSSKLIEIYLPSATSGYPGYFPYWLEVQGMVGSAKVRIIDSGSGLRSPRPPL